jgi:PilZ domain
MNHSNQELTLWRVEDNLERRRTVRYNLCLPLVSEWVDENGRVIQEPGFTRDISTGGLYVNCVTLPSINSTVRLQIVLPPNKETLPASLRLAASATVVRLASEGEANGFAAVGELATQEGNQKREIHAVKN